MKTGLRVALEPPNRYFERVILVTGRSCPAILASAAYTPQPARER
jgi:hypothetical protein